MSEEKRASTAGGLMVAGMGGSVAIGVAVDNIPVGLPAGTAVGIIVGILVDS